MNFEKFLPENLQDIELYKLVADILTDKIKSDVKSYGGRFVDKKIVPLISPKKSTYLKPQLINFERFLGTKKYFFLSTAVDKVGVKVEDWDKHPDIAEPCDIVLTLDITEDPTIIEDIDKKIEEFFKYAGHICLKNYLWIFTLNLEDYTYQIEDSDLISYNKIDYIEDVYVNLCQYTKLHKPTLSPPDFHHLPEGELTPNTYIHEGYLLKDKDYCKTHKIETFTVVQNFPEVKEELYKYSSYHYNSLGARLNSNYYHGGDVIYHNITLNEEQSYSSKVSDIQDTKDLDLHIEGQDSLSQSAEERFRLHYDLITKESIESFENQLYLHYPHFQGSFIHLPDSESPRYFHLPETNETYDIFKVEVV